MSAHSARVSSGQMADGLGVGGEFAVGVSLVAEVMPERARPYALGLLQALSVVGNVTAALASMALGQLEHGGAFDDLTVAGVQVKAWRLMFVIGVVPALLAIVIRMKLREPERWQDGPPVRGDVLKGPREVPETLGKPRVDEQQLHDGPPVLVRTNRQPAPPTTGARWRGPIVLETTAVWRTGIGTPHRGSSRPDRTRPEPSACQYRRESISRPVSQPPP